MPSSYDVLSVGTGETVVLAGISGRFPQTDNMRDFARNLYEKRDLVDDRELRWKHIMPDVPKRTGKVNNLDRFDWEFFGVDRLQRDTMDPQQRMLIEHTYEAILDAGVNPESIRGSRTGVFCGICFSETEVRMYYKACPPDGLGLLGCAKSQMANRVSYMMDFKGPSFVVDTACSSSMYALDIAYRSMMNGECDAAIVMGCNLTLHPYITYQFALLGVLSKDGYCRPFDKDATGYSRSEAACAVFLQKAKDAKRIYSYLVHSKTNCDGFKPEGITYPSGMLQQQLLNEFYSEVGIAPKDVDYVEAHSTGTFVGDPEECEAIDKVYCAGRKRPLPVGSVKSSIGHSEASAGVCSIAKCIIAMENGIIPPNIHYVEPKPTIESLVKGRLKVIVEATPLDGPLVAINCFGFGGANAHALLCRNLKEKKNHGLPGDDIPRLAVWSGRTKEAVVTMLQDVAKRPLDTEFFALLYNIQKQATPGHRYRGFGVYRKNDDRPSIPLKTCVDRIQLDVLPLTAVFGGINVHWREDLDSLGRFPQVELTFARCNQVLNTLKFDLSKEGPNEVLYNMVGTTVLQLALVDLLSSIGVEFDFYAGHSVGQITCGYIDLCLNLEQAIKLAFLHGLIHSDCRVSQDAVGFVKMNSKLDRIPICNVVKDEESTFGVFGGDKRTIADQLHSLASSGLFVGELPFQILRCGSSKYRTLVANLQRSVHEVLPRTFVTTSKWITAKMLPTHSLFHSPTIHEPASVVNLLTKIPRRTYILELGTRGSCEKVLSILNRNSSFIHPDLEFSDAIGKLLSTVGRLHLTGQTLHIDKLYPAVQFPVSRGTTMISPLIRWDHLESAHVVKYSWDETDKSGILSFKINLSDQNYKFVAGHCIDGRILFPATGYLQLVWELLSYLAHRELSDYALEFEEVRFLRATTITAGQSVRLLVVIQDVSGFFEILEGDTVVVTGYARSLSTPDKGSSASSPEGTNTAVNLPTKDFYKELRLRGYHYTGLFKSVLNARSDGAQARIQWNGNWVAFLDCMLQVGIIAVDTRSLMVPTEIDKITIAPKVHLSLMERDAEERDFYTMNYCSNTNVSTCGGITISNPRVSIIGRRNPPGFPVLETYHFVPYRSEGNVTAKEAIRMCVQLALENVPTLSVYVAEVHNERLPPVVHWFGEAVADLPLVKSNLTLLSNLTLELDNVEVKNDTLADHTNLLFLVTSGNLDDQNFQKSIDACLVDCGFVLLRQSVDFSAKKFICPDNLNLLSTYRVDDSESFVLFQRKSKSFHESPISVRVRSSDFSWLGELKKAVKFRPVVLYSQEDSTSGIIGLVNCIRKEPKLQSVRCVFIDDPAAPPFDLSEPFYQRQLDLGLAVNVYRGGAWGSYRHALLRSVEKTEPVRGHCYANCFTKGDLSSMMWFTGAMNERSNVRNKARAMYCSLNFRDAMVVTGRLSSDVLASDRLDQECELGFEFAGVTEDGTRVMGAKQSGALATLVEYDPLLTWIVPESWSLQDACTVPIVYGTVFMAFFINGSIRKEQSILIHAGSGGVGLAAIQVALVNGLEVFTTVSTEEKKTFLLQRFPSLRKENIGHSRDTSFEQLVKIRTNGRGVDYVLNSLADDKLQASIRCLGKGGHFLEIGKYDMARNTKLSMQLFRKGLTFSSIMLDLLFKGVSTMKQTLHTLVRKGLADGAIKPLNTTEFNASELEKAMRFLASGKHTGKILIKLRQHEKDLESLPITYVPREYCNPEQVCVIVGGLGGFGLELADWLIIRGCRKLVLSSSRGVTKPYQKYRIQLWNSYGVKTIVSTADVTNLDGCRTLLRSATAFGVVSSIFNLAVQLRDSILDNQTVESFIESLAPKAKATEYLDKASRELCPRLKQFVVFSSVSCGRGNAGQSNYGMANSVMERIIERRRADGFPAKAIQWGAIGEVGLVADMAEDKVDMEIGGTLQQRISSCLQELDRLLVGDEPIVASMVVAEKRAGSGSKNIIEAVMNIMSIRELKSVSMESTLADIGMDSLMAVEIKQLLERDFDLILTPQELRTLTFAKLLKMEDEKMHSDQEAKNKDGGVTIGMQMLLRNLGNEDNSGKTILRLASASDHGRPILIIPGLEGVAGNVWISIAARVNAPVLMLQLMATLECDSIPAIVDCVIDELCSTVFNQNEDYAVVGYSFGSFVAIEITKRLQAKGMHGKLLLLDGAPKFLKTLSLKQMGDNPSDEEVQRVLLSLFLSIAFPNQPTDKILSTMAVSTFNDQIEKLIELTKDENAYTPDYTRRMVRALFKRLKMAALFELEDNQPLDLPIMLVRPTELSYANIEEDYGLSNYTTGAITLRRIEGSHMTMLENPALPEIINSFNL
ncbi:fatty acid synthase-like [Toxorhynchites rutilus septentrionalis]|uniref:fatty acid synthase-like n=1 Tax=Toxorhynchites rutilus septentrionalis TaxID=329112 RepID=UPI00247AD3BE|nr:fatty acid synthase-like [Toxorhynchites rutilus septentrionalis]